VGHGMCDAFVGEPLPSPRPSSTRWASSRYPEAGRRCPARRRACSEQAAPRSTTTGRV